MNAIVTATPQSNSYRRKAADLARQAEAERDEAKMRPMVHQALSWMQLAENDELLSQRDRGEM